VQLGRSQSGAAQPGYIIASKSTSHHNWSSGNSWQYGDSILFCVAFIMLAISVASNASAVSNYLTIQQWRFRHLCIRHIPIDTLIGMIKFRAMSVLIEMSLEHFNGFMDKCDHSCLEYRILITAVVIRRPKADDFERIVQIRCDLERAKSLLDLATQIYPAALPDIEKAIAASRDS
jgi:hypothetical protein